MKLSVERLPESQVRLDITSEEQEFTEAFDRAVRRVSREISVPGFRKGKAPRHIIERMYGREVFLEETNRGLMDQLYRKAIEESELVPVGEPDVEFLASEPLQFAVTLPVYPTIDPGDYKSVRVEPVDATIEESAIDEVIERVRLRSSPWVDPAEPRSPIEGDQVTVDLEMTGEDGEPFQDPVTDAVFILGESQLFDGLRTAIESLSSGESTETTIAFADDDEDVAERLRGTALTYKVTLKAVRERQLLEVDDEFAKSFAGEESLEELRAAIREDLHQARTQEARTSVLNEVIATIADGATVEVPAAMVDDAVTEEMGRVRARLQYQRLNLESYLRASNQTEDELRAELRPQVTQRLRNSLILREIAEREGIEVKPEDLDAEIAEITVDAPDPDQARKIYSGDRYMRTVLANDLFDRRLSDLLLDSATEGRGAVTNAWTKEMARTKSPAADAPADAEPEDAPASDQAMGIAAPSEESKGTPVQQPEGSQAPDATGVCPDEFPIKGNASSHIYHEPGSQSYDVTEAEICFASHEAAVAAGYRAPKVAATEE